jgi:hypothetical protein
MRRLVVGLSTVLIALLAVAGCSSPDTIEAIPDIEFTLTPGQTAKIAGEDLSIKFVEVVSDSRCPKGATCIWAGEASCLIEITSGGATVEKVLTQSGADSPDADEFGVYELMFDLMPYPELGKQVKNNDYSLLMAVSRKPV